MGRRYAIVVEAALAIPPGQVRIPKGALGPICERYGVSPQYPSRLLKSAKDQINANQEVDLSSKGRKGRPSLLTPSKVAALKKVNSQNRSFTLRQVWAMNACSVDELVESIYEQYEDYDGETLERVSQSLFKVYNQTLRNVGDNDFAVEHTGVRKRQREGTLEKVVKYDKEAFERAYAWMASSPSDDEDD